MRHSARRFIPGAIAGFALLTSAAGAPVQGQGGVGLPSFSPDGRQIGFSGGGDIYLMNADGTNARSLPLPAGSKQGMSFSPDGTHLLYRSISGRPTDVASMVTKLIVTDLDGKEPRDVATGRLAFHGGWSPDGRRISYVTSDGAAGPLGTSFIADADGSNARQIATRVPLGGAPRWSRDGTHIVFPAPAGNGMAIFVANADGGSSRQLTTALPYQTAPVWSNDGRWIAFLGADSVPGPRSGAPRSLYVVNADGTGLRRVLEAAGSIDNVRPSPDGRRILFQLLRERGKDVDLCVVDADGTNERCFSPDVSLDEVPSWSPDGKQILFQSNRDGVTGIYLMNGDGSGARRIR